MIMQCDLPLLFAIATLLTITFGGFAHFDRNDMQSDKNAELIVYREEDLLPMLDLKKPKKRKRS